MVWCGGGGGLLNSISFRPFELRGRGLTEGSAALAAVAVAVAAGAAVLAVAGAVADVVGDYAGGVGSSVCLTVVACKGEEEGKIAVDELAENPVWGFQAHGTATSEGDSPTITFHYIQSLHSHQISTNHFSTRIYTIYSTSESAAVLQYK